MSKAKKVTKKAAKKPTKTKRTRTRLARKNIPFYKNTAVLLPALFAVLFMMAVFATILAKEALAPSPESFVADVPTQNLDSSNLATVRPDFANYQNADNAGSYVLLREDTPVLEKNEHDWPGFYRTGDWLYFYYTSQLEKNQDGNKTSFSLYAYNLVTQEYNTVGSMNVDWTGTSVDINSYGDYLYIHSSGYKSEGYTYRCSLNDDGACGELNLFNKGSGRVYGGGGKLFALKEFGDAGFYSATVTLLNNDGTEKTKVKDFSQDPSGGEAVITIDTDGYIWTQKVKANNSVEYLGKYDSTGLRKAELHPADIPITDFYISQWADADQFVLRNDTKAYVYDTIAGTFQDITPFDGKMQTQKQEQKLIEERLNLNAPFSLEHQPAD